MSEGASVTIELEEDSTPFVRAIAADLSACLTDARFAEETARLEGSVLVRSAATPEAATVRLGDGVASIRHGGDEVAGAAAVVDPGGGEPQISAAGAEPGLAAWLEALLQPPLPSWQEAAERFWAAVSRMDGAPEALLVVDLDSGEQRRLGSERGSAYEIQGNPGALVRVLTGRTSLILAAFEGSVFIRGSFPQLSVLSGAGFAVRYGGWDA